MDFKEIVERERIELDKIKRINPLLEELETLRQQYYDDEVVLAAKEKRRAVLFDEFKEYFTEIGFDKISKIKQEVISSSENLLTIDAIINKYRVSMSISEDFIVTLHVMHKNDSGFEEYRIEMDHAEEDIISMGEYKEYASLDNQIKYLEKRISNIKLRLSQPRKIEIILSFEEGQGLDKRKCFKSFKELIEAVPEK